MGKKAKFKQIRKAVQDMPSILTLGVKNVHHLSGASLIESGVKEVNGKPIDPKAKYRQIERGGVPINHERRMKKIYMERGVAGVNQYIKEVFYFSKMEEIKLKQQSNDDGLQGDDSQTQHEDNGDTALRSE
jgi:hypothetical protein